MRFSDAIRAGAKLHPQSFSSSDTNGRGGRVSCAVVAALDAVWAEDHERKAWHVFAPDRWPELRIQDALCPVEHREGSGLCEASCRVSMSYKYPSTRLDLIWKLNDIHMWTREEIADWYEATFEQPSDDSLIADTVKSCKRNAYEKELVEA